MADAHEVVPNPGQDELTQLVGEFNQRLAQLPPGVIPTLDEREYMEEALEDTWPYSDEYCAFSGWCRVYSAGHTPSATDYYELQDGIIHGLVVAKFGGEAGGHWAIGMDISQPSDEQDEDFGDNYILDTSGPYGFVPYDAVDSSIPEGLDFPDVHSVLSTLSDDLVDGFKNFQFYTLSRYEQKHFLDQSIKEAEQEVIQFGVSAEEGTPIGVGAPRAYIVTVVDKKYQYAPLDIERFNIVGTYTGLEVMARRRLTFGKKIETPEHAVDVESGLCLKVRIDKLTAEALSENIEKPRRFTEGTVLYVPISGQHIDVLFDEDLISVLARERI